MKKAAIVIIIVIALTGLLYPYLAPYDPGDFSFEPLLTPSAEHLLGTNDIGQDIFSILLAGFRSSVFIAVTSALISTGIGTLAAVSGAYFKGAVDRAVVKLIDFFIIIPEIIVIMFFAVFAGPGLMNIVLAISLFSWSRAAKVIRSKACLAISKEAVQYTLMMKGTLFHVIGKLWYYIFPSVITMFVLQCSKAILYEANLAFLGIGDPTIKSWGILIKQAMNYEGILLDKTYLWWLLPPIFCIVLFVFSLSILCFDLKKEIN